MLIIMIKLTGTAFIPAFLYLIPYLRIVAEVYLEGFMEGISDRMSQAVHVTWSDHSAVGVSVMLSNFSVLELG